MSAAGFAACVRVEAGPNVDRLYVMENGGGLILGRVFEGAQEIGCAIPALDPETLVRRYWGRYVALFPKTHSGDLQVLRDPSGSVPCQFGKVDELDVIFMCVKDFEALTPGTLGVNSAFIRSYLLFDSTFVRSTGISEISAVLPGELLTFGPEGRAVDASFLWNPLAIAREDQVTGEQAATLLRQSVEQAVKAWAGCFDSILLELSGGLDSSIIAQCLGRTTARSRTLCRNFFSSHPGSDERRFAQAAARSAGLKLLEEPVETQYAIDPDTVRERVTTPYPWWMVDQSGLARELAFMSRWAIDAIFNGDGGDEVFYFGGCLPTAVDFAWEQGLRARLLQVAYSDALAEKDTLWSVLKSVMKYAVQRRSWHMRDLITREHMSLMPFEVKRDTWRNMEVWHPLFRQSMQVPPGKFGHAYLLCFGTAQSYVPAPVAAAPIGIAPLRSQPVLEASLRIPLYELRFAGRDRALARDAFSDALPPEIRHRSSKAVADFQVGEVFRKNIRVVRELLLDGFLARERLIKRDEVEQVLSGKLSSASSTVVELGTYLNVEGWARCFA